MAPRINDQQPNSESTAILLRSFLEREREERKERVQVLWQLGNDVKKIAEDVATISGKIIRHDEQISGLIGRVKVVEQKQESFAEDTGQHELVVLQNELKKRDELIAEKKEIGRHWTRYVIATLIVAILMFANGCFSVYVSKYFGQGTGQK